MAASAGRCSRSPIVKPGVGFVKGQVPLSFLTSAVVLLAAVREEEEKKRQMSLTFVSFWTPSCFC